MSSAGPAIRTDNVSRHYTLRAATIRALDGVSLDVQSGDFVALLGTSGSGKSTLLNLIAGLDHPTSGSITVQGRELSSMTSEDLARYRRHTVGMVFQAFNLIPTMTLLENVELPMRFAEVERADRVGRARAALEQVGIAHRADHRPTEVSGGEQQRAALARALVNRPAMLLADEPTGNLDSQTAAKVLDLLAELVADGLTLLVITHDPAVAERAHRTVAIHDGKLTEQQVSKALEASASSAVSDSQKPGGAA